MVLAPCEGEAELREVRRMGLGFFVGPLVPEARILLAAGSSRSLELIGVQVTPRAVSAGARGVLLRGAASRQKTGVPQGSVSAGVVQQCWEGWCERGGGMSGDLWEGLAPCGDLHFIHTHYSGTSLNVTTTTMSCMSKALELWSVA